MNIVAVSLDDIEVTLKVILSFVTGAEEKPLYGFHARHSITFDVESDKMVSSSTCALVLMFSGRHDTRYDRFKEDVTFALLNSQGFGKV